MSKAPKKPVEMMNKALEKLVEILPRLRDASQIALAALLSVVILTLGISHSIQQLPAMLVIATVPLIAIIACFAFLGVAAATSTIAASEVSRNDQHYVTSYSEEIYPALETKAEDLLGKHAQEIQRLRSIPHSYQQYRALILGEYHSGDQAGIDRIVDSGVEFFTRVLECQERGQCSERLVDTDLGKEMVSFWYSFRPILEEMRFGAYAPSYAQSLQQHVEHLQPPESRSTLSFDSTTRQTRLKYPQG